MSNRKASDAKIKFFYGPFFPEPLEKLQELYPSADLDGHRLEEIGRRIPGFIAATRQKTSDGYEWFWCLEFNRRGTILVTFPWTQDFEKEDGSLCDRHIAIYYKYFVDDTAVNQLIEEIVREIQFVETA